MTRLKLRQYDAKAASLLHYQRVMAAQGETVTFSLPPPGAVLAHFSDTLGHEVLIDLRRWFELRHPSLAPLAIDHLSNDEVRDWFHYGDEKCELELAGGLSFVLSGCRHENDLQNRSEHLPEVKTSLGIGWLVNAARDKRASSTAGERAFRAQSIPLSLGLILGRSLLKQRYVKRLQCGDVLIIREFVEEIKIGHYYIGKYQLVEDKLVFDDFPDFADQCRHAPTDEKDTIESREKGINNLPVKLEFVVHEKTVTYRELDELCSGDVIATTPQGKDSISIRANGTLIGRGELIWVGENLCVEVQTIYSGTPDGK